MSKVLGAGAAVSTLLMIGLMAAAGLVAARRPEAGLGLAAACLGLMLVMGVGPLGVLMLRVFETRFPPWTACGRTPDGIVVLDGALQRLPYALALARRYPKARIIYSGKLSPLGPGGGENADPAALLEAAGLTPPRLTLEIRSRDTYENALYSKALARPRPGETWLLVTSAFHMPRAFGAFRAVGFPVQAYPVDYRTQAGLPSLFSSRVSDGLALADLATREAAGLLAYRLTGRSAALWPAPPERCRAP